MNIGDIIERDGKKYVVTDVFGQNFGMREYKEEDVPVFEATRPVEEPKEEPAEETPKKKVVRRKKA